MAATSFTPISLYYSSTASNVPTAGNLVAGELAINTADGKLFYKDSGGVVQTLATKDATSGSFTNLAYTGTLTGGTGVVNLGSGQFYKDASGNVGIGTSSPAILGGNFKNLVLQGGSTTNGGYYFTQTSDGAVIGQMGVDTGVIYIGARSNHPLVLTTNNTERMRINAAAPILCLAGGNTTATGTGIAFPATQSASSDANTLDDYEEGTWTPSLTGFTTVGGNTAATGTYTKIGRVVYLQATITYATSMAGVGGTSYITGLPFTPSTPSGNGGFANDSTGVPINVISVYPSGVRIYFPTFGAVPGIDLGITYAV